MDEQGTHTCVSLDDTLNISLLTQCVKILRKTMAVSVFLSLARPRNIPQNRLVRPHGKVYQQSRRGQTQTKEGNASKSLLFCSLGQKSKVPLSQILSRDASGEPQPQERHFQAASLRPLTLTVVLQFNIPFRIERTRGP